MTSKCNKCDQIIISNRRKLSCSLCINTYHLKCTNVAEKRFQLMTPQNKVNWKCQNCLSLITQNKPYNSSISKINYESFDMPEMDLAQTEKNIINVPTENSFDSLPIFDTEEHNNSYMSTIESCTMNRSCPELRNLYGKLETVKRTNTDLETNLKIAENEIEQLLSENISLKKQIEEYKNKLFHLTKICKSTEKIKNTTGKINMNKTKMNFTQILPTTPVSKENADEILLNKQNMVSSTPSGEKGIPDHINKILLNNITYKDKLQNRNLDCSLNHQIEIKDAPSKPNIFILSDEQTVGLSTNIIKTRINRWNDRYKTFALIKPNASSSEILNCCSSMVKYTNKSDVVIICTGGNDANPNRIFSNLCIALHTLTLIIP